MLQKLIVWQQQWAIKKILFILALGYLIFPFYLLPQILPEGRILDLHLYYSAEYAYDLIKSYGDYNRERYVIGSATIDMIYPLYYATFLGLILRFFIDKIDSDNCWQYFSLAPYVIMIIDFSENLTIIAMLSMFPDHNDSLAMLASALTSIKWLLFFIVGTLLIYFPIHYFRQAKSR